MSDGNRTVFRPSPLQGLGGGTAEGTGAPPPPPPRRTAPRHDDVPEPARAPAPRSLLIAEAAPILALAAAIRSGRAHEPLQQFHAQASAAVARFDRTIAERYAADVRQRATYALCSTIDDIAQNLPGIGAEASEWARRSLVVQLFRENIGGDRFWQIVEELLARPAAQPELIELLHACLAAGFEGRFRMMPDGKRRLAEIMTRLYGALEHPRSLSDRELVPHWRGAPAPEERVGRWSRLGLAAAAAAALLLLVYIGFRLLLMQAADPAWDMLARLNPAEPLRLSRGGEGLPAAPSAQAARLEQFLAPEIAQGLVTVDRDAATVRVRTTVGQLFRSGSDQLEPGREALFGRIGEAVNGEPGPVAIEGHADSDQPSGLTFPDNNALSAARAEAVAAIVRPLLADPARLSAQGFGDSQPIAPNDSPDGKATNRRVEIVLKRQD